MKTKKKTWKKKKQVARPGGPKERSPMYRLFVGCLVGWCVCLCVLDPLQLITSDKTIKLFTNLFLYWQRNKTAATAATTTKKEN